VVAIRDVFPGPLMVDATPARQRAQHAATIHVLSVTAPIAIQIEDQVFPNGAGTSRARR